MTSQNKRFIVRHRAFLILLGIYVVVNLLTLTKYPRVWDDEGFFANWAYLLHKNGLPLIDHNLSNNGGFKGLLFFPFSGILFYGSMAIVGHCLGFGFYAMRLHPLAFAVLSIVLTYKIALLLLEDEKKAFYSSFFLAASSQFLSIAHGIRPESMLIAFILGIILLLIKGLKDSQKVYLFLASFFLGSSVCVHPNGILLPFVFFTLFYYQRNQWKNPIWPILIKMAGFTFLGGLLFLLFDYMPYRDHYWQLFHSPFFDRYTTHRYAYIIKSPLLEVTDFIKIYWLYFWSGQYHRQLFYFAINMMAIVGGLYFRSRTHNFLLLALLLLHAILLPTHRTTGYFAYFIPFFSILTASVVVEIGRKIHRLAGETLNSWWKISRISFFSFLVLYSLHPLLTLWGSRNYNYHEQVQNIKSHVTEKANLLASSSFFFDWPNKAALYPLILLKNYHLEKLLSELNITYFIWDYSSREFFKPEKSNEIIKANNSFLSHNCKKKLVLREYQPGLYVSAYSGEEIILFDCASTGSSQISN